MALPLSCACGARFEVEDTFAGQTVACPECRRGVPAASRPAPRTSGYALASSVLALVLTFTLVGTAVAVFLGLVGLARIARHRGRLAGTGYCLFGIVWGTLFTGVTALGVFKGELFGGGEMLREGLMGGQVERGGPLEVRRPGDGYAITRPSARWAVAKPALVRKLVNAPNDLMLVNLSRDAYVHVAVQSLGINAFDTYRDDVLDRFRDNRAGPVGGLRLRLSDLQVRHDRRLPDDADTERAEILLDVKVGATPITYLVRMVHPKGSDTVYLIRAWSVRRRFAAAEPEIRRALDSFRLIDPLLDP